MHTLGDTQPLAEVTQRDLYLLTWSETALISFQPSLLFAAAWVLAHVSPNPNPPLSYHLAWLPSSPSLSSLASASTLQTPLFPSGESQAISQVQKSVSLKINLHIILPSKAKGSSFCYVCSHA